MERRFPRKRRPRAPQAHVNNGSGDALGAGPGTDASPARQALARKAGRPERYNEVSSTLRVGSHTLQHCSLGSRLVCPDYVSITVTNITTTTSIQKHASRNEVLAAYGTSECYSLRFLLFSLLSAMAHRARCCCLSLCHQLDARLGPVQQLWHLILYVRSIGNIYKQNPDYFTLVTFMNNAFWP